MSNRPPCEHPPPDDPRPAAPDRVVDRAARIFRALGEPGRLRVLELLLSGELCVSDIAARLSVEVPTVSHRLRVLHRDGLVRARRDGRHIHYALADDHVLALVRNALSHADEHHEQGDEP